MGGGGTSGHTCAPDCFTRSRVERVAEAAHRPVFVALNALAEPLPHAWQGPQSLERPRPVTVIACPHDLAGQVVPIPGYKALLSCRFGHKPSVSKKRPSVFEAVFT